MEDIFSKHHIDSIPINGFWDEVSKHKIIHKLESAYKDEILAKWHISEIVPNGEKFIIKWRPNVIELTSEQIKERYR